MKTEEFDDEEGDGAGSQNMGTHPLLQPMDQQVHYGW